MTQNYTRLALSLIYDIKQMGHSIRERILSCNESMLLRVCLQYEANTKITYVINIQRVNANLRSYIQCHGFKQIINL